MDIICDIKERINYTKVSQYTSVNSNLSPLETTLDGFPLPKKRHGKGPCHNANSPANKKSVSFSAADFWAKEAHKIHHENQQIVSSLPTEDILALKEDIGGELGPTTISRILARMKQNKDSDGHAIFNSCGNNIKIADIMDSTTNGSTTDASDIRVVTAIPSSDEVAYVSTRHVDSDASLPRSLPIALHDHSSSQTPTKSSQNLILNVTNNIFLVELYTKYFSTLPTDAYKIEWMSPVPIENSNMDKQSPYYPGNTTIALSALRFNFNGILLNPEMARIIPTSHGLHHHSEAPEAAGYTVGELAVLARSVVPAQRCVAFQTLGRILFRLGAGYLGDDNDELVVGILAQFKLNRVIEILNEAAGSHKHKGSQAYAAEALSLFGPNQLRRNMSGR